MAAYVEAILRVAGANDASDYCNNPAIQHEKLG
jgi:hypothetical protein